MTLTNYQSPTSSLVPTDHEMMVFHTMAEQAVESRMYKGIGDKSGVMMVMLAARELGISPMQALNGGINLIQGKVEISARMMSAMIRRAGHSMQIVESTDSICTLKGTRRDNGDTAVISYSISDAQKAGLVKAGGSWYKIPKDMLFARCMSRLARQLFSDVIGIGYVEGEIKPIAIPEPVEEIQNIEQPAIPIDILLGDLKEMVKDADKELIVKYAIAVQERLGWTQEHTLMEFLLDKDHTLRKFEAWKQKQ